MKWTSLLALIVGCGSSKPAPVIPAADATCADLSCLETNDGRIVDVEGAFRYPTSKTNKLHARYLLEVAGAVVVLRRHPKLTADRDGQRIVVRGRIYVREIPERYGIIASTSDPYLVEVFDVR